MWERLCVRVCVCLCVVCVRELLADKLPLLIVGEKSKKKEENRTTEKERKKRNCWNGACLGLNGVCDDCHDNDDEGDV